MTLRGDAQDRDIGLLVGNGHHQCGDNIKRGHRNNQRQDDEHHFLFHLYGAEVIAVLMRPVVGE
jgi:hypothetical protein